MEVGKALRQNLLGSQPEVKASVLGLLLQKQA